MNLPSTEPTGLCRCGARIPAGSRFCQACGTPAAVAPPTAIAPASAWSPAFVGAPSAAAAAASVVCSRCGRWLSSPGSLCGPCQAGQPVPAPAAQGQERFEWKTLLWFVGLFAVAWIGRGLFSLYVGPVVLLVATFVLGYVQRRQLAAALAILDRWSILRPFWRMQAQMPRGLRLAAGIVVPIVLAFILTPWLNRIFSDYGFLVFTISLAINTVVSRLFFAAPPPGVAT